MIRNFLFCTAAILAGALSTARIEAQTSISISNNSFESPVTGAQNIFLNGANSGASSYLTGWSINTTHAIFALDPNGSKSINAESGTQFLENFNYPGANANSSATLYQQLTNTFIAGDIYTLTAYAGYVPGSTPIQTSDTFSLDNTNLGILSSVAITGISANNTWTEFTDTFTATANYTGNIVIAFNEPGGSAQSGIFIDNFALAQSAPSSSFLWSNTPANALWTNGANWTGGTPPTNGAQLIFATSSATNVNNNFTNATFSGLYFTNNASSYTVNGNNLSIGIQGLVDASSNNEVINVAISGPGSVTAAGTGTLTLKPGTLNGYIGGNTIATNGTLLGDTTSIPGVVNDSGNLILALTTNGIAPLISGSGSLTVNGASTLTMNFNNSYTGGTTLNGATVIANGSSSALGTGTVTFASNSTITTASVVPSTALGNAIVVNNGVTATINAGTATNGTLGNPEELQINGAITGPGSVIFASTPTNWLTLQGNNTYSGGTTLNGGIFQWVSSSSPRPFGSGSVTIAADSTYRILLSPNITNVEYIASGATLTISNPIVSFHPTFGTIAGPGSLNISGITGTTVTLNASNSYTGTTTIQSGTLALSAGASISDSGIINLAGLNSLLDVSANPSYVLGTNQTLTGMGGVNIGSGTLTVNGHLSPDSKSEFYVDGFLTLGPTAVTTLGNDTNGASYSTLNILNGIIYNGTLDLSLYLPTPGQNTLLQIPNTLGNFTNVVLTGPWNTGASFTESDGLWYFTGDTNKAINLEFRPIYGDLIASLGTDANLNVGSNSSGEFTNYNAGNTTISYYNTYVGYNVGDSNNTLGVSGSGTLLTNSENLYIGYNGSSNAMIISNGGSVYDSNGIEGYTNTSYNNSILVTGSNSTWSNSGMGIGEYGSASNSLVISNGASIVCSNDPLYSSGLEIGLSGGSNNTILITDKNSNLKISTNGGIHMASDSLNNSLIVSNGALLIGGTDSYGGYSNTLVVTGSNSLYTNSAGFIFGYDGTLDSLVISNGATAILGVAQSRVNAGVTIGYYGAFGGFSGNSNNALVTGTNSLLIANIALIIGNSSDENSLVISNGGTVISPNTFVGQNGGNSNLILVTGTGSTLSNSGYIYLGNQEGGIAGTLTVADGGGVSAAAIELGYTNGTAGKLNIGSLGGNDTSGSISTPSITFGPNGGAINFNQANSFMLTSSISGNGVVNQLGTGTTILSGSNSYTGLTEVSRGGLLINGQMGSSTISVDGGTLGGTGTIAGPTRIGSGGHLTPGVAGSGSLTFTSFLLLNSGATTSFTIAGTNGATSISLVGNSVIYGGTLNFLFSDYTPEPGDLYTLFNMTAGASQSGDWSSVQEGSLFFSDTNGVWSAFDSANDVILKFTDATGQFSVNAVPEPAPGALFGIGVFAIYFFYHRKKSLMSPPQTNFPHES